MFESRSWRAALTVAAVLLFLTTHSDDTHAQPASAQSARAMSGIWWSASYQPQILPLDGSELPFTEEGRRQYEENVAGLRSGEEEDHSRFWCSPDGIPRIWAQPYPFQIAQTEKDMVILYERNAVYRVIPIDTPMPDAFDLLPYFMGNSYGHWEDDSFVIEAAGFKAYTTYLDDTGVPMSFDLRITERMTKLSDDQMEVIVTIEDPEIFTEPWDTRFVFEQRDDIAHLDFWVCGEEHRDVSSIEGVQP
jgi:hypothetical protein